LGRENKFIRLEFETAAWTLHFWGKAFDEDMAPFKRRQELTAKLGAVQNAVAAGIKRGSQAQIPQEILGDEHGHIRTQAQGLHEKLCDCLSNDKKAMKLLRSGRCHYKPDRSELKGLSLERPLWIAPDDPGAREKALRALIGTWERNRGRRTVPGSTRFHQMLTASLFAISSETLRKRLCQGEQENRHWDPPSDVQRYLVAMFLIGARTKGVGSARLLKILTALRDSGYRALALYHLAKRASMGLKPTCAPFWRRR